MGGSEGTHDEVVLATGRPPLWLVVTVGGSGANLKLAGPQEETYGA